MRFRVTLAPWRRNGRPPRLSYSYQYGIAAMLYDLLRSGGPEYDALHARRGYKFFTFSRLEAPRRRATPEGLVILSNDAYLWFSSPDAHLARILAHGITMSESVEFGGVRFSVLGLSSPGRITFTDEEVTFTTLSPIVLRRHEETPAGPRVIDMGPDDPEYAERLMLNLVKKYTAFYGHPPKRTPSVVDIPRSKNVRIEIKGTFHKAHLMDITLEGSPDVLGFAYDCGLGEKNAMGCGMIACRRGRTR